MIQLRKQDAQWLVKDPSLEITEPFQIRTGSVLVTRKVDLVNSLKVTAVVPDSPASGGMWLPADTLALTGKDGKPIDPKLAAKALCAWMNSTMGLVVLLSEREETRAGWSEWKTERARSVPVLDLRTLAVEQVQSLARIWESLKDEHWPLIRSQLDRCLAENAVRRDLDMLVLEAIGCSGADLDTLYLDLRKEFDLLHDLMSRPKAAEGAEAAEPEGAEEAD